MNQILEKAIDKVRKLSDAEQADIAALLMTLTGDGDATDLYTLSDDERAAIRVGLAQARAPATSCQTRTWTHFGAATRHETALHEASAPGPLGHL